MLKKTGTQPGRQADQGRGEANRLKEKEGGKEGRQGRRALGEEGRRGELEGDMEREAEGRTAKKRSERLTPKRGGARAKQLQTGR